MWSVLNKQRGKSYKMELRTKHGADYIGCWRPQSIIYSIFKDNGKIIANSEQRIKIIYLIF